MKFSEKEFNEILKTKKYVLIKVNEKEYYAYDSYEDMIRDFPEFK